MKSPWGGGWIQDPGGCSQWQPTCSRGVSWNDFLILKKISQFFRPCFQPSFHGIPPANSRAKWAESWPAQCCAVPWFGSQKLWFEVEISDFSCFQSLFVSNVHGVKFYFFTSKLPNAWGKLAQTNFPLKLQTSGQRLAMLVGYHRNGRVNIKGNCCHLLTMQNFPLIFRDFAGWSSLRLEVWKCSQLHQSYFSRFYWNWSMHASSFFMSVDMIWKSIAVSCLARSWLQRVMEAFGQSASWRRAPWEVQSDEMLSKPSRLSKLEQTCELFELLCFQCDRYSYTWITCGLPKVKKTCQVVKPHWNLQVLGWLKSWKNCTLMQLNGRDDHEMWRDVKRCEAGNDLWNVIVECAFDVGILSKIMCFQCTAMHLRRRFVRSTCWKSSLPWLFNRPASKHLSLSTFNSQTEMIQDTRFSDRERELLSGPEVSYMARCRQPPRLEDFFRTNCTARLARPHVSHQAHQPQRCYTICHVLRSPSAFVRSQEVV